MCYNYSIKPRLSIFVIQKMNNVSNMNQKLMQDKKLEKKNTTKNIKKTCCAVSHLRVNLSPSLPSYHSQLGLFSFRYHNLSIISFLMEPIFFMSPLDLGQMSPIWFLLFLIHSLYSFLGRFYDINLEDASFLAFCIVLDERKGGFDIFFYRMLIPKFNFSVRSQAYEEERKFEGLENLVLIIKRIPFFSVPLRFIC